MSGTTAQLKIEVGLSTGKVGYGKTELTNQLKTHLGRRMKHGNFPSNLMVQLGGGCSCLNISLASKWPVSDWLGKEVSAR